VLLPNHHLSQCCLGHGPNPSFARPASIHHAQETKRRLQALELSQAGGSAGYQQRCRASRLERNRARSPTGWSVTWPATIRNLKFGRYPGPSICAHRNTLLSSASMRRPPFRPWIGSMQSYPFRRDEPSVTASSTSGMARCPCRQRWTPRPVACMEKTQPITPAATSSLSSKKSCACLLPPCIEPNRTFLLRTFLFCGDTVEIYVDKTPPGRSASAYQTGLEIRRTVHPRIRIRKSRSGLTQVRSPVPASNNISDPINRQKH
jgi:hypothetical protein